MPDRLAPLLEGQTRVEIHRLMTEALTLALAELARAQPIRFGARGQ